MKKKIFIFQNVHLYKITICVFLISTVFNSLQSRARSLVQTEPEISVITEGPASDLYTSFGHIAVRVKTNGSDLVYSFGTFDFNTPFFYLKFIQGSLLYMSSITDYLRYVEQECADPHTVVEQMLALTTDQKKDILNRLSVLTLPVNRYYKYDFLYNNCSTKVRDALSSLDLPGPPQQIVSFRSELHQYFVNRSWLSFGVDLVLGAASDKVPTASEVYFLPKNVYAALNHSSRPSIVYALKQKCALPVKPTGRLLTFGNENLMNYIFILQPFTVFLTIALCSFAILYKSTDLLVAQTILFMFALVGCLLAYLDFFSEHLATKANYNLIWCAPFGMFTVFCPARFKPVLGIIGALCSVFFLCCCMFFPQKFDAAIFPLICLLMACQVKIAMAGLHRDNVPRGTF